MAGIRKEGQGREAAAVIPFARSVGADPVDPFGMAEWMKNMPNMPLNPLMAHPAAAVAAATALGFGLSSHIAGIMFGAMQGAASALQKGVAAVEPAPRVAEPSEVVAPAKPAVRKAPAAPAVARKPKAARKPAAPAPKGRGSDDLKRISGIGPKLEQVLNGKGIRQLADIVALSEADVARLDAEFGLDGRIARDDWVGQAKALMKEN
ncbi:MAG TPA: helix-hairpin-helix domain-containing protein [Sinorhizobium sp.]|nr:helix-hairpin-helix domain-containing protein [Sinorhizobium sp.]